MYAFSRSVCASSERGCLSSSVEIRVYVATFMRAVLLVAVERHRLSLDARGAANRSISARREFGQRRDRASSACGIQGPERRARLVRPGFAEHGYGPVSSAAS